MRWLGLTLLATVVGCHACSVAAAGMSDAVAATLPEGANPSILSALAQPLDLPTLWGLALVYNPELHEAAADVDAARGRCLQASKYPNPHFQYEEEDLGTSQAAAGTIRFQLNQEIVTAGKRRLDVAVAHQAVDAASLALLGRRYEVLTRVRRAYFEFLGWVETARVSDEVAAALEQSVETVRKLVEEVKSRPRTDLLRIQALWEEAKIQQARSRANMAAAWLQTAAEVGVPCLPMPTEVGDYADMVPQWAFDLVSQRVLTVHTELRRAALETKRASLEVERARAEAVPNIQVGGGYSQNFPEHEMGAVISVQTPLPLWDRKQGLIHEAQARWARAQAAQQSTATRLSREIAEAFARYQAADQQVQRLRDEVLPRLIESQELVRKGYQAGAAQLSFADVQLAVEALNDTRLKLAEARRELWRAIADLQGLMQLDLGEDLAGNAVCQPPS